MELLREYGSDTSDGDDAERAPKDGSQTIEAAAPLIPASADILQVPVPCALVSHEELERRRQAIARTFVKQAVALDTSYEAIGHVQRHRMTHEERAFEFRGYVSKRRRHDANSDQHRDPQRPAVAELPPLFAPDDAPECDDDEPSSGATAKPSSALPARITRRFKGHTAGVNGVQWNPKHADLFLSASMDASVRMWNYKQNTCNRALAHHNKGVKSAKWSLDGRHVLSGSYDGCAVYADAETVTALQTYHSQQHSERHAASIPAVTSVCVHPSDSNLFLIGTSKGCIYSYDLRQPSDTPAAQCRTYEKALGDVHDLLFLSDEHFVSSTGIKYRDASHQTLLVWDFRSSALLSERLDRDLQPFQCLRLHPREPWFIAQSSADFALFFSAQEPYKHVNKGRSKFQGGHEVQGFAIQCSFNYDGSVLATGDANGRIFYYDTTSRRVLRILDTFDTSDSSMTAACICAEFQPFGHLNNNTNKSARLVAGGSNGQLLLYE